jgi:hypothetical protein
MLDLEVYTGSGSHSLNCRVQDETCGRQEEGEATAAWEQDETCGRQKEGEATTLLSSFFFFFF